MLTGVQIETYTTRTILKHVPFQHYPPSTFALTHLLHVPPPKKLPGTSYRKVLCPKSAKTSHVGITSTKKLFPQKPIKQATMHTAMHAHTIHTSQCNA